MATKVKAPSPKTDEPIKAPPVDNDSVEEGAEKFDDDHGVDEFEQAEYDADMAKGPDEPPTPELPEVVVTAPTPPPPPRSIGARIRDVEKRWGKNFEHVMLDLHDHVFGTSPPHDESDDPLPPKGE